MSLSTSIKYVVVGILSIAYFLSGYYEQYYFIHPMYGLLPHTGFQLSNYPLKISDWMVVATHSYAWISFTCYILIRAMIVALLIYLIYKKWYFVQLSVVALFVLLGSMFLIHLVGITVDSHGIAYEIPRYIKEHFLFSPLLLAMLLILIKLFQKMDHEKV